MARARLGGPWPGGAAWTFTEPICVISIQGVNRHQEVEPSLWTHSQTEYGYVSVIARRSNTDYESHWLTAAISHVFSATTKACFFCHNERQGPIKRSSNTQLASSEIETLVRIATAEGVDNIKLTGGEPLLYRSHDGDVVSLVRRISNLRTTGIGFDLSMTTNGTLLAELSGPLVAAGLDRVTISLTTMDWRTFTELVSPSGPLLTRMVAGVAEAWTAGLRPTKINVPVYYSARRGIGNLYELPQIVEFASDHHVAEVRFFTLLSHENFPAFQEYYQFFSPEMRDTIARCLLLFGIDSVPEIVDTLTWLGASCSGYRYPKVEFGVSLGATLLVFEPMRYGRFGGTPDDQEGPYAMRIGADGSFRPTLGHDPDYCLIDAVRSNLPDGELRAIYRAAQEEMP